MQDNINKLAKAHATLIAGYSGLDPQSQLLLATQIIMHLTGQGATQIASREEVKEYTAAKEPEEALNFGSGEVLSPQGFECVCDKCGKVVYKLGYPLRGKGVSKGALIKIFEPVGHDSRLHLPMNLLVTKNGSKYIDCPLCKGSQSLLIAGEGEKQESVDQTTPPVQVGSIDGGQFDR